MRLFWHAHHTSSPTPFTAPPESNYPCLQTKAIELLHAHVRTIASTAAPAPSPAAASPAAKQPPPSAASPAAGALKPHMKGISAALAAAVAGVGMKPEHQAEALKAAVGVVEAVKRIHPGSKLGEVMGPERINLVAKAVATVRVRECVCVSVCVLCVCV